MSARTYEGFRPHQSQRRVIDSIIGTDAKYHIACISRQWGKTIMAENMVLYWAINDPGSIILWVSPVYSQANRVQKELVRAISAGGIIKSNNYSANEITLNNGSHIYFRSAERYDNIRGLTCDYGVIDEAAFIPNDAFREAIEPVFLVRGARVLFVSTPKGRNFFYDLYQLGQSPDHPNYVSYRGRSVESPFIAAEAVEEARKTLPEKVFKQEYEAEFIDDGGEVFTGLDKITVTQWPNKSGKVYCGIDVGRAEDYTVATFMDSEGQIIDIYRNNNANWNSMVSDIVAKAREYDAQCMVEVNGVGDPIYEQIRAQWPACEPFTTSNKSKQEIIEGLILDVNEENLKIPHAELFPYLYHEMQIFTYEYSPKTRTIRYGHPKGHHDDTVMSLAIANYCRKQRRTYGSYAYITR